MTDTTHDDLVRRPPDEEYDTPMEVGRNPHGAWQAIQALTAERDELAEKLEKAVEALMAWKHYNESDEEDHVSLMLNYGEAIEKTRTTLAELKGQGDE
jgi:hypothetical protein